MTKRTLPTPRKSTRTVPMGGKMPDGSEILWINQHVARETHECDGCLGVIRKGQTYDRTVSKGKLGFQVYRAHADCMRQND